MAKEITVKRWLDEEENEHTTKASADYEDARRKILWIVAEWGGIGHGGDDVITFISQHPMEIDTYLKALKRFKTEGGHKIPVSF